MEAPRCAQSPDDAPGPNRAWEGGGGGGTAGYGSAHSPTVPTLLGGGGATWGPHPRSTHGCPYPPRTQRTCVCAPPPTKHPKHPWVHAPQGAPLPRKGATKEPPPRRPLPAAARCRFPALQVRGGGLRAAVGGRGPRQVGAAGLCLPPPPCPLPALPSRPVPSSEGQGGPLPRGEPRGCPRVGTSSGPGPQVPGWLQPLISRPFVTRTVGARSRRWPWEGAGALQELLWL